MNREDYMDGKAIVEFSGNNAHPVFYKKDGLANPPYMGAVMTENENVLFYPCPLGAYSATVLRDIADQMDRLK